jgi:hypothetical protein
MEIASLDSHLSRAASRLGERSVQDVVQELHTCEQQLVARRFIRKTDTTGALRRVRVPEVEAALIHVSRALSLISSNPPHPEEALDSINCARLELSHTTSV